MRTTFLRRTTLHVSQRRLTEARTFMKKEGTLVIMRERRPFEKRTSKELDSIFKRADEYDRRSSSRLEKFFIFKKFFVIAHLFLCFGWN